MKRSAQAIFWVLAVNSIFLLPVSGLEPAYAASSSPGAEAAQPDAQSHGQGLQKSKQIPVTPPPMGWSSWNSFSNTVDSKVVMGQTKALVDSRMKDAGYQYVNIDEGWWLGQRDRSGNIVVDAKQWPALHPGEQPGEMSNIVRFIHGYGLKAGIYTDAGESGCSFYSPDLGPPMPHTGSEGHYDEDFLKFAQWGFDYVKVDWCGGDKENLDPAVQYEAVARAITRAERLTGRRLYYSICNWGKNSPWTWAPGIAGVTADIWRTSGDIVDPIVANTRNSARKATLAGVLSNFDQGIHPEAQHTGFYNDPDMMMVGMQGLSETQNRVHMSLWAISGAPLIVGADLTKLSTITTGILTNREVLAIDQDKLGLQAIKVDEAVRGLQVWAKPLSAVGAHAVLLLNRTAAAAQIEVGWDKVGLDASLSATVRDLWTGKELGSYKTSYAVSVPANDTVLLTIRGSDAKAARYESASAANEFSGGARPEPCNTFSSKRSVTLGGERSLTFKVAPIRYATYIQIHYSNRGKAPIAAELNVDGHNRTKVLFPPTGDQGEVGTITIAVDSKQSQPESTLQFSSPSTSGLALESLSILARGH